MIDSFRTDYFESDDRTPGRKPSIVSALSAVLIVVGCAAPRANVSTSPQAEASPASGHQPTSWELRLEEDARTAASCIDPEYRRWLEWAAAVDAVVDGELSELSSCYEDKLEEKAAVRLRLWGRRASMRSRRASARRRPACQPPSTSTIKRAEQA